MLTDAQRKRFEETMELDFSFGIRGLARFRCNVFNQRGAVGGGVPAHSREDPHARRARAAIRPGDARRAPTRSGARHRPDRQRQVDDSRGDDRQNQRRTSRAHPHDRGPDRVHPRSNKKSLVNQREVHSDTGGFGPALRAALREDPDIVLIGEIRDLETVEAALKIAETGHLTFASLHTNSAAQTINRIIDVFPASQQSQIGPSCRWCSRVSCARRCCRGPTERAASRRSRSWCRPPAIRALIRDDKVHQIYGIDAAGQEKLGMQTANQSLATLYMRRLITLDEAMKASSLRDELQDMINRGVGVVAGAGLNRRAARGPRPGLTRR